MSDDKMKLEQVLHGYHSGHRLLATSVPLCEESARRMAILSDLSGAELKAGFEEYYTCYELLAESKIVISKTWYAHEMRRPGCVWTHSFLVNKSDKLFINELLPAMLYHFKRPTEQQNYDEYTKVIELSPLEHYGKMELESEKLKYILWSFLGYGEYVLVPTDSSTEYANETLYLWGLFCGEKSISTGSLASRRIEKQPFNFQLVPMKSIGGFSRPSNIQVAVARQSIKSYPVWLEKAVKCIEDDELKDFYSFWSIIDHNYNINTHFVDFMKLYIISNAYNRKINVCDSMSGIEKIFINNRASIGNAFLSAYFHNELANWGKGESSYVIINYLINSYWIDLPKKFFSDIIKKNFETNKKECGRIFKNAMRSEFSYNGLTFIEFCAKNLEQKDLLNFSEYDTNTCELLILVNPFLAQNKEIWTFEEKFQIKVIKILKLFKNKFMLIHKILPVILNNSKCNHIYDLYETFGKESIHYFVMDLIYNVSKDEMQICSLKRICTQNSLNIMVELRSLNEKLNTEQAFIFIELIDPSQISYTDIPVLIKLYGFIEKEKISTKRNEQLAVFYLILLLKSNDKLPIDIAKYSICLVHEMLLSGSLENEYWNKIKYYLPESSFIEHWDKGKQLRKAIKKKGYHIKKFDKFNDDTLDISLL